MSRTKLVSVKLLRDLPLFSGLSDEQLEHVVPLARLEELAAGEELLRAGGPAADIRLVVTGKCSLSLGLGVGEETFLLTMTRGEIIGWSAMLERATWLESATALRESSIIVIGGASLRALCESDRDIGYHVMRNLFAEVAARLHDTRLQLLDMYGHG